MFSFHKKYLYSLLSGLLFAASSFAMQSDAPNPTSLYELLERAWAYRRNLLMQPNTTFSQLELNPFVLEAMQEDNKELLERCLQKGFDPNALTFTLIFGAAKRNLFQVLIHDLNDCDKALEKIDLLLKYGADPSLPDSYGNNYLFDTPEDPKLLSTAIIKVLKLFEKHNMSGFSIPLHNVATVRRLLEEITTVKDAELAIKYLRLPECSYDFQCDFIDTCLIYNYACIPHLHHFFPIDNVRKIINDLIYPPWWKFPVTLRSPKSGQPYSEEAVANAANYVHMLLPVQILGKDENSYFSRLVPDLKAELIKFKLFKRNIVWRTAQNIKDTAIKSAHLTKNAVQKGLLYGGQARSAIRNYALQHPKVAIGVSAAVYTAAAIAYAKSPMVRNAVNLITGNVVNGSLSYVKNALNAVENGSRVVNHVLETNKYTSKYKDQILLAGSFGALALWGTVASRY